MINLMVFKPVRYQLVKHRDSVLLRLHSSTITRRIKLISFKICEAILRGDNWRYQSVLSERLRQFEQELCSEGEQSTSSHIVQTRQFEVLEVRCFNL
jgi:hypothetical protein